MRAMEKERTLDELIEYARNYRMTPEEQDEQIQSFAFGNTHLENSSITRDDIRRAADSLKAERATTSS